MFDVNVSKSDLEAYLDVLGTKILKRDLIEFKTAGSNIVADDIIVKTQDGISEKIEFHRKSGVWIGDSPDGAYDCP